MLIDKRKLEIERAKKQLNLSDLGVSKATIARINKGSNINPVTIGKIAKALGCEVEDILEAEGGEASATDNTNASN